MTDEIGRPSATKWTKDVDMERGKQFDKGPETSKLQCLKTNEPRTDKEYDYTNSIGRGTKIGCINIYAKADQTSFHCEE